MPNFNPQHLKPVTHENDSLDPTQRGGARPDAHRCAAAALPRDHSHATPQAVHAQTHRGHGPSFVVGSRWRGTHGQTIQITKVTADFIGYLDVETEAHGQFMRRFFTELFTPFSTHE